MNRWSSCWAAPLPPASFAQSSPFLSDSLRPQAPPLLLVSTLLVVDNASRPVWRQVREEVKWALDPNSSCVSLYTLDDWLQCRMFRAFVSAVAIVRATP